MSHHLASVLGGRDSRLNITDLYVFEAGAATALVMNVGATVGDVEHPDLFHPEVRYEFKIHFDGNDREDLTYRLRFLPTQHEEQSYDVERLAGADSGSDVAAGTVIARGVTGQRTGVLVGGEVWAGRAVEPFYLDMRQMDDVDSVVRRGAPADLTRWVRGVAADTFLGATIRSIVLTVPVGTDGLTIGRQVAAWATTKQRDDSGSWQQVGRTGLPVVCTIFRPLDSVDSSRHERTHPADDAAVFGPDVADLVASTVELLGTSDRPGAYADSVMERIVPDVLRYVVGSPAVFGFARFNGRRLADNAPEVIFSLATNSAITTGLRATDAERCQEAFPFVIPVDLP
jgi:hypothetical protein